MKVITIIILVVAVIAGWFVVLPLVAPGVTEKTVVRDTVVVAGDTLVMVNQSELAVGMYENALGMNRSDPVILKKKGAALFRCGRIKEAEGVYQQVLRQDPDDPAALVKAGDTQARQGNLTGALEYYDAALVQNPRDSTVLMKKGDACLAMSIDETRQLQAAARNLTGRAGAMGETTPSSQSIEQMHSYRDAMASYQKAMEIDPKLSIIVSTRVLGATQNQLTAYQDILNKMGS